MSEDGITQDELGQIIAMTTPHVERQKSSLTAPPCSAAFDEWCKARGVWPRLTREEIWYTAWNAAIEVALLTMPGGSICDPQTVVDRIRAIMSPNESSSATAGQ